MLAFVVAMFELIWPRWNLRLVVLLAQSGHLVLRLTELSLDRRRLGLGVGDRVTSNGARKTKHSARQHCDNGQRGDTDPLEQPAAP